MPGLKNKKRYARAVRFRTIASNNSQTRQTRRFELVPTLITIVGQVVTVEFDRPVTVLSDAVALTGVVDQASDGPTTIFYTSGTTQKVDFTFPGGAPTSIIFPFEDPAVRDQIAAYVRPGEYTEPDLG